MTSDGATLACVKTVAERCRMCYTCVRECPAKAIRIVGGQAEVLTERCICCGNCVKVCSQNAKQVVSTVEDVERLLASGERVAACLAPSAPAEFGEEGMPRLVGMIRKLGFGLVAEVAAGADLVARKYAELAREGSGERYIATTCPALVEYVRRYQPEIVDRLAPVVSPMIAAARILRKIHPDGLRIVFIGPCIAKKREAADDGFKGEIDAALTFVELRSMFESRGITAGSVEPSAFDPPHPGLGMLFPVSRGLLQAADMKEDLLGDDIVVSEGRRNFVDSVKEFKGGGMPAKLLEVLCCSGCIRGPGMSTRAATFERRSLVSAYTRERLEAVRPEDRAELDRLYGEIDLACGHQSCDQRVFIPGFEDEVTRVLEDMGKTQPEDELNCGACGYDTCREHAIAVVKGLAESEMCLPFTIERLRAAYHDLAESHDTLANTQVALMQAEKLASMGQLAAGIAHEVNNPLGVVLLYAHLMLENATDPAVREDVQVIAEQADRCKKIVSGLLHFARSNKIVLEPTNVVELLERMLKNIGRDKLVTATVKAVTEDVVAEIDRDQIMQVMVNLYSNALDAMPEGGSILFTVGGDEKRITITVRDTGQGIPREKIKRVFEPFYTTKQLGKGTGLGLSVTYGIIKMHKGDISVKSNADPAAGPLGTEFTVTLPRRGSED